MKRIFLRMTALIAIFGISFSFLIQCYGNFPIVRLVYKVNGQIGSKVGLSGLAARLVNTLVMWILMLFFVYGISGFVDMLIMNAIEFWTGNKIDLGSNSVEDPNRKVTMSQIDSNTMEINVLNKQTGKSITHYLLKNEPGVIFEKVDGKFVRIEMEGRGEDENFVYLAYRNSKSFRNIKVEKETFFKTQEKTEKIYTAAAKKNDSKIYASAGHESAVVY